MIVTLYSKLVEPEDPDECHYCNRARGWLEDRKVPFAEIKLNREARQQFYQINKTLIRGATTVPQVILTDEHGDRICLGGADQLPNSGLESLFINPPPSPSIGEPQYEVVNIKAHRAKWY